MQLTLSRAYRIGPTLLPDDKSAVEDARVQILAVACRQRFTLGSAPRLTIIVDSHDRIREFVPQLEELVTEGLVMTDDCEVIRTVSRSAMSGRNPSRLTRGRAPSTARPAVAGDLAQVRASGLPDNPQAVTAFLGKLPSVVAGHKRTATTLKIMTYADWTKFVAAPLAEVSPGLSRRASLDRLELLVRRKDRQSAYLSILAAARQHGVPVNYIK